MQVEVPDSGNKGYKFSLYDYHAIEKAEIILDGITVLAGENGCGKSTLSRWLYYIVNTASNWEVYIFDEFKQEMLNLVRRFDYLVMDIARKERRELLEQMEFIENAKYVDIGSFDRMADLVRNVVYMLSDRLASFLETSSGMSFRSKRVFSSLDIDLKDKEPEKIISEFQKKYLEYLDARTNGIIEKVENRHSKDFFQIIHHRYHVMDDTPSRIQLSEEGVKILKKDRIGVLFNLDSAIYVDTPMALQNTMSGYGLTDNVFWGDLQNRMMGKRQDISADAQKILLRIRMLMKGYVKTDKQPYGREELRYVRRDGLNIKLEDTATGLKAFAYIQRLLENGHLNEKTLLLIDEPEAHLHPQWVVEFAKLLVYLHKEMGVKVMVASHNPDMVAAIQRVSQKEGLIDRTHFYQTFSEQGSFQYVYRDLGGSIAEIFESFNIALSRIQGYGAEE